MPCIKNRRITYAKEKILSKEMVYVVMAHYPSTSRNCADVVDTKRDEKENEDYIYNSIFAMVLTTSFSHE